MEPQAGGWGTIATISNGKIHIDYGGSQHYINCPYFLLIGIGYDENNDGDFIDYNYRYLDDDRYDIHAAVKLYSYGPDRSEPSSIVLLCSTKTNDNTTADNDVIIAAKADYDSWSYDLNFKKKEWESEKTGIYIPNTSTISYVGEITLFDGGYGRPYDPDTWELSFGHEASMGSEIQLNDDNIPLYYRVLYSVRGGSRTISCTPYYKIWSGNSEPDNDYSFPTFEIYAYSETTKGNISYITKNDFTIEYETSSNYYDDSFDVGVKFKNLTSGFYIVPLLAANIEYYV